MTVSPKPVLEPVIQIRPCSTTQLWNSDLELCCFALRSCLRLMTRCGTAVNGRGLREAPALRLHGALELLRNDSGSVLDRRGMKGGVLGLHQGVHVQPQHPLEVLVEGVGFSWLQTVCQRPLHNLCDACSRKIHQTCEDTSTVSKTGPMYLHQSHPSPHDVRARKVCECFGGGGGGGGGDYLNPM